MAALADTDVLLDVATRDRTWAAWSLRALEDAALEGKVLINAVIYAEFSIGYARIEDADRLLVEAGVEMVEIPRAALFLAGKAFGKYRRGGGVKSAVLPDFFIGAHAAAADIPLITRDKRRYRRYFPTLRVIVPKD
jgi:hypothetical protein